MLRSFLDFLTAPFRWLLTIPSEFVSAPRRFWGLSAPLRAAIAVFLTLLLAEAGSYFAYLKLHQGASLGEWFFLRARWIELTLLIVIPIIVYFVVKWWLEEETSEFPDIEQAWDEGIEALRKLNIKIWEVPVYLILGVSNRKSADALMRGSGVRCDVFGVTDDESPLYWYGNRRNIYLVCREAGALSALTRLAENPGAARIATNDDSSVNLRRPGLVTLHGDEAHPGDTGVEAPPGSESSPGDSEFEPQGGMESFGAPARYDTQNAPPELEAPTKQKVQRAIALGQGATQLSCRRLRCVCKLLLHGRDPYAALNGILAVVPLDLLLRGADGQQAIQVQQALRADLDSALGSARTRVQTIVTISRMERETGFMELARRVREGRKSDLDRRFGARFELWNYPKDEQIDAVSFRACMDFETWTFRYFEKEAREARQNPRGNCMLYGLLCKIRSELLDRLKLFLEGVFSRGEREQERVDAMLFGGCYFAATSEAEGETAFLKGIFQKLQERLDDLDWIPEAQVEDHRNHVLANWFVFANVLLVGVIIGCLVLSLTDWGKNAKTQLVRFIKNPSDS